MRIAAREAELSWIASVSEEKRSEAARIYKRQEELEDHLADENRQEAPVVLSGRTARYARFQGNDFPLIAEPRLLDRWCHRRQQSKSKRFYLSFKLTSFA